MLNSANAAKANCVVDAHPERARPCCLAHGVEKVCPHLAIAWQWAGYSLLPQQRHCFEYSFKPQNMIATSKS